MQGFRDLIQLHLAHEAERTAARRQEALNERLAALEAHITAARTELEAAETEVKRLTGERRAAEMEVQKLEDTRKKYREQLMGAKTNEIYKTLLHEIETVGHAISARETVVLEALESADGAGGAVAAAKKAVAAAEAHLAEERKKLLADVEMHEAERREARALAESLEPAVPVSLLNQYKRIRDGRDGRGMALAVSHECTECRVAVLPQAWVNLIAKEDPYQCSGCKRMLYRKENLVALEVAKEQQPAGGERVAG